MFFRTIATILAAGSLMTAASPAPSVTLTPNQEAADVALMRRAYERVHPGLYRYQDKAAIDAAFDRLAVFATRPHPVLAIPCSARRWRSTRDRSAHDDVPKVLAGSD